MSDWFQDGRTKSLIDRSAIVTQALKANEHEVGRDAYLELQSLERQAVAAGATYEIAQAAEGAAQVKRDATEKDLAALNSACLVICRVKGVSAAAYEGFDRGDAMALAVHLETPISRIEAIGKPIAGMLRRQRDLLAKVSGDLGPFVAQARTAEGELRAVLFKLEGSIALSRALLATKGVVVKFPKAARKKKSKQAGGAKPSSVAATVDKHEMAAPMNGGPSNGASSVSQPPSPLISTGGEVS